jgi:hypothetical protein
MRLAFMNFPIDRVRSLRLACTVAAVFATAACGTKDAPDPLQPTAAQGRIRFVNLITDPSRNPVNAILENVPFGVNLAYTGTSPSSLAAPSTANFAPIYEGARSLVLKKTADTNVVVATLPITVTAGTDYTLYATGGTGGGAVTGFTVAESNPAITTGQVRIKFVNMSPTAGAVDVFITAPNADLVTATPAATNVATRAVFPGALFAAGAYQIRTVPAGTAPAARPGAVNSSLTQPAFPAIPANAGRTIVLADAPAGGTPLRSFALPDQ